MASRWSLPPQPRAAFATAARLLSCLVTESLLTAVYVPIPSPHPHLTGIALILSPATHPHVPYHAPAIFAVIPLRHIPIFKPASTTEIGLLNLLDMLPFIYNVHDADVRATSDTDNLASATLIALVHAGYADTLHVEKDMHDAIAAELNSSLLWQQYAYEHPPPTPTFNSPSITWEQSIIEGHPTHPMHKARHILPPIPPVYPGQYNWSTPRIHLVAVPRTSMNIHGPWEELLTPLLAASATRAGTDLVIPKSHVAIPVHELQLPNIRAKFPEAHILPPKFALDALAQQSLRTMFLPDVLPTHALKLALGIRLTSAMRTISPPSAYLSAHLCSTLLPVLTYDRTLLIVQHDRASVSHIHPDPDIAKHLAGIVRDAYESTSVGMHGERVVVCTALMEVGHGIADNEVPLVQALFALDTEAKRLAWLDIYITLILRAFLPPVLTNAFAFEAHPQNTLARFSVAPPHTLTGFVIRDFGGVSMHMPTVLASTGLAPTTEFAMPGHTVIAKTLGDVYAHLYHALVHNHLQELIRVLGLHYNGKGWGILRREMQKQLPEGHELRKAWLGEGSRTVPGKCFMRMRMRDMYRSHLHGPFPNLIHYEGESGQDKTVNGVKVCGLE